MSGVRRSLFFALADSYFGVVLQLVSTLVISRVLAPDEIGVYAVAAVFAALASTFRDFGVAEYLIQEKELTTEKIQAAFAANLCMSWLMALALYAFSGTVADFYREPGVAEVLQVLAISFLLIPFGAITMAYFRRQLDYRPVFIIGVTANATSFVIAVAAALHGGGYMSLAWAALGGVIVTVLGAVLLRPASLPTFPGLKGIRQVLRFGKHATGIYVFGQVGKSAPEAIIGRALDMASVAFFSRANGLMEIFNRAVLRAIMPVCLPYFSLSVREGNGPSAGYLKVTTLLTGIGWPFFAVMGLLAMPAIRLLYGPQWMESVPLAQILCLAAMLELPYFMAGELMIAHGRIDQANRLQFLIQLVRIAGLMLIIPFGLTGACWGLVGAGLVNAVISHGFLSRVIGLRVQEMARACLGSIAVAASCSLAVVVLLYVMPARSTNHVTVMAWATLAAGSTWLLALRAFRHDFWDELSKVARSVASQVLGRQQGGPD